MMGIEGIIFDFNGTLIFDMHLHNQAWDLFLAQHNIVLSDEEKTRKIHGKNNPAILSALFPQPLTNKEIEAYGVEKESIYQQLCLQEKLTLAPGVEPFLEHLNRIGMPFTIATSSDYFNVAFYFEHFNLGTYFDLDKVVYNDESLPSKPHPEIFLKAMDKLKITPENTCIFEDAPSGIIAAERAQAKKIIMVKSSDTDYSRWKHQSIRDFLDIDHTLNLITS